MANKETYGYTAPQYFYWSTRDGGGKYISNGATNYVKKYYDYYWDYPKKKVYYDDEGWDWKYIYVNGNHPTVSGSGAKLTGTGKADYIRNGDYDGNSGDKVTIETGAGKDTISNSGDKANINAGAGNDSIQNDGAYSSINGGAGNDTIQNWGKNSNSTIEAGTGKDTIGNSGSNVSINATADSKADYIFNDGKKVKIAAGGGSDMIENYGSLVTIFSGAGDDTITNREGDNVKIYAGDGDNLISIVGSKNVTLQTGNNLDSVVIRDYNDDSSSVSIQSGAGKNFISLKGDNSVSISGGENEIHFAGSDDIVYTDDENASITVFFDSSGRNTLNTGAGDDTVWIKESSHRSWWNDPFVVDTGYQNDSIRNEMYNVSIETGYGKDTVENWGGQVTIQSGDPDITAGKNLIKNHVDAVTIQGGGQADTIENYTGRNVSINGGRGNDVIKLYSTESMENFLSAALNPLLNVVKDFNLEKINSIIDIYNTLAEAIDGFEKVSQLESSYKGKNQIKIRDRLQKISDKAGELDEALEKSEEFLKSAGCGTDKISVLRKSTDKIQQVAGKGIKFSDNTEIMAGMVKEYADNKIWSTVGKELASDFEKIDGRLSFVAKKPGGIPTTVHGGKGNDKIYSDERKFHVYEYAAGDGKDTIFSWNSNDTLSITGGAYTGEIVGGDYVVTVGKGSVTFKNYTSRNIQQVIVGDSYERLPCQIEGQMLSGDYHTAEYFYDQPATPPPEGILVDYNELTVEKNFSGEINLAKDYASYVTRVDASNAAGNVEIIGSDSTENIRAGKGNDNIATGRSFTVIHSGAGKDIVSSSGDGNSINSGADNDVIVNVGNENSLDAGAGNDTIISSGQKNIFLVNDGGNKVIYGFGVKDTLRITDADGTFSKENNGDDIIVTGDGVKITLAGAAGLRKVNIKASKITGRKIENSYANEMIQGTGKADTISNTSDNVTIDAGAGNDSISNGGDTVTIIGGKGNDYVDDWGGIGTAYVYSAGNDSIEGFNEWDTIVLGSLKVNSSVRADDGTVTLNLSNKKTLTLLNYWSDNINLVKSIDKVKKINVIRNYDSSVEIKGTKDDDNISNGGDNVSISAGKGNDYVFNYGSNVSIDLGAGNDEVSNLGYNSTLAGGKGNDSLWGGYSNAEKFLYFNGDGDDIIFGFGDDDTLTLDNIKFKASYKDEAVTFSFDGGSVTLREFNAEIFHVNDDVYKISGSKLKKQ